MPVLENLKHSRGQLTANTIQGASQMVGQMANTLDSAFQGQVGTTLVCSTYINYHYNYFILQLHIFNRSGR